MIVLPFTPVIVQFGKFTSGYDSAAPERSISIMGPDSKLAVLPKNTTHDLLILMLSGYGLPAASPNSRCASCDTLQDSTKTGNWCEK